MVRLPVLLRDVALAELVLEVVATGGPTEQADGEHAAVVGECGGREAMRGSGFTERGEHDWSGHGAVGGDGQGVAGAVIEPGQDLHIGALLGAADAATVGEVDGAVLQAVVGEVGLPGLVRLLGLEPDVAALRPLVRRRLG